jgi:import inner membrane translocase subunit TIM50
VLKHYQGKNIPVEYAKYEAEGRKKAEEDWALTHPTSIHGAGSGYLSGLFGSVTSVSLSQVHKDQALMWV